MPDPDPGDVRPRRLLDHAPSERYAAGGTAAAHGQARGRARGWGNGAGLPRGILLGLGAAVIGAAVHVGFAVLLLATGGLLVLAATLGFVIGVFVRYGAGPAVRAGAVRGLALALTLVAVAAALAVNWSLSGRYLDPLDFLTRVYGTLVPLQVAAAAAGALAGTR